MEAKLNKIILNYLEKTGNHLFAKKINENTFEYMKSLVIERNNQKIHVLVELDNDFSIKNINLNDGRLYDYYDAEECSSKHSVDTYVKSSIFGHGKHGYYSIPGKFKINDGIKINEYIDNIVAEKITEDYLVNLRQEYTEKLKTSRYVQGTYRKYNLPEGSFHLNLSVK
jgi:hypothetical protein